MVFPSTPRPDATPAIETYAFTLSSRYGKRFNLGCLLKTALRSGHTCSPVLREGSGSEDGSQSLGRDADLQMMPVDVIRKSDGRGRQISGVQGPQDRTDNRSPR